MIIVPIGSFSCPLCFVDCEGPTCLSCLQEITALFHPKIEGGRFYWFEKRNDSANLLLKNRHYYRWPHSCCGHIAAIFNMKTGLIFHPVTSIDSVITDSNKTLAQHINFFNNRQGQDVQVAWCESDVFESAERSHGSCFNKAKNCMC